MLLGLLLLLRPTQPTARGRLAVRILGAVMIAFYLYRIAAGW